MFNFLKKSKKEALYSDSYLIKFNLVAGALHLVQAVIMTFLVTDSRLPVTLNFLTLNSEKNLVPDSTQLFTISLAFLTIGFLALSALAHFTIATVYKKQYLKNLKKGINKARWIEYSLSASTMMVAIAFLSGIYDLGSLLMIFTLVAGMNLMGLVMELWNQTTKNTHWLSYRIGCLLGIVPWIVFGLYVWGAESYGAGSIPTFVYYIYGSIFVFFNSFALNMYLQYKKVGKWSHYLYGERAYIILSLVAKSALAWQVFAGSLRP